MKLTKSKCLILLAGLVILINSYAFCQFEEKKENADKAFFFDAVCFKNTTDNLGRVDVYVIVPYESLEFVKAGTVYGAGYDLLITVTDSNSTKVMTKPVERKVTERDYFVSQGGTGSFDFSQTRLSLAPGKYTISVDFTDSYNKETYQRARIITVLDFTKYNFSVSGILLVSAVEENNGKYVITPHISDNIGDLTDGFFAFVEAYNKENRDSADFVYEISDKENKVLAKGTRIRQSIKGDITQHIIKVKFPNISKVDNYTLKIIALNPSNKTDYDASDYLAIAERSVRNAKAPREYEPTNLDDAIRQMRYVANQSDIDNILAATNQEEKQKRFEEYWKKLDPTPNTDANEAYEEYYSRVQFANKNFRSYTEGWLTDKGKVFIIYGRPSSTERSSPYADSRVYERWTYRNGRQFTFVDNSGFGDFRLYQPMAITDKYRYGADY